MKIEQIQLILKERSEDTVHSEATSTSARTQHLTKGVRHKPQPSRIQALPPPQLPSRRKGVGAGREWEPRTAKHPALPIRMGSADTHCVVCWILGKQNSKICEQVPTADNPWDKRKASAF